MNCRNNIPLLKSKVIPWIDELCSDPKKFISMMDGRTSPIEVLHVDSFRKNALDFIRVLEKHSFSKHRLCFARKANPHPIFLEAARELGIGLDVTSQVELEDALECGFEPEHIVLTAAVKSEPLLKLAAREGVIISVDNWDELKTLDSIGNCSIILRVSGWQHDGMPLDSRFGFHAREMGQVIENLRAGTHRVEGLHFHLKSYGKSERVSGIRFCLSVIDQMKESGFAPRFIDIGGGFPVDYLGSELAWDNFESELKSAVLEQREPITYQNTGMGWANAKGKIAGSPAYYPFWSPSTKAVYLDELLSTIIDGSNALGKELLSRGIEIQVEPGRALLDEAGCLLSRVATTKMFADTTKAVFLFMNRTQLMSSSMDFCVDPVLLGNESQRFNNPSFLFGSYCVEHDVILKRKLELPDTKPNDIILFPNTAAYVTSLYASESHSLGVVDRVVYDR